MKPLSLQARADLFNSAYRHLPHQHLVITHDPKDRTPFMHGFWFVGGHNVSSFYGSYQTEYLNRIATIFPDARTRQETVHLFSGSLPPSEQYTRVGTDFTGQYGSDLQIDAHNLSSHLPFKPSLILADPPYSIEDSEHYKCGEVNRAKIVDECGLVLRPGGFLVWMDQSLPCFKSSLLTFVGAIGYVRSTGNRFRMVSFFQRNIK